MLEAEQRRQRQCDVEEPPAVPAGASSAASRTKESSRGKTGGKTATGRADRRDGSGVQRSASSSTPSGKEAAGATAAWGVSSKQAEAAAKRSSKAGNVAPRARSISSSSPPPKKKRSSAAAAAARKAMARGTGSRGEEEGGVVRSGGGSLGAPASGPAQDVIKPRGGKDQGGKGQSRPKNSGRGGIESSRDREALEKGRGTAGGGRGKGVPPSLAKKVEGVRGVGARKNVERGSGEDSGASAGGRRPLSGAARKKPKS